MGFRTSICTSSYQHRLQYSISSLRLPSWLTLINVVNHASMAGWLVHSSAMLACLPHLVWTRWIIRSFVWRRIRRRSSRGRVRKLVGGFFVGGQVVNLFDSARNCWVMTLNVWLRSRKLIARGSPDSLVSMFVVCDMVGSWWDGRCLVKRGEWIYSNKSLDRKCCRDNTDIPTNTSSREAFAANCYRFPAQP